MTPAKLRVELEALTSREGPAVTQDDIASTVEDLFVSDEWPEVSRYGQIRKLSATFLIPTPVAVRSPQDGPSQAKSDSPILFATRLELALSAGWIISVWHPVFQLTQSTVRHEPPAEALHRVRDTNALTVSELVEDNQLTTSGDLAVAILSSSVGSFSPHRKELHQRLDNWEHDYYAANFSATEAGGVPSTPVARRTGNSHDATRELAEIHACAIDLSRELDHLSAPRERAAHYWVGPGNTSRDGGEFAENLDEKIDRFRISLRDIRDRVRAGLDLSHSVESARRDADSRLRDAFIAKVAAIFLAPTLVAGFYGINTKYPDAGTTRGTTEAIVLMVLSAVLAWRGIVWFESKNSHLSK